MILFHYFTGPYYLRRFSSSPSPTMFCFVFPEDDKMEKAQSTHAQRQKDQLKKLVQDDSQTRNQQKGEGSGFGELSMIWKTYLGLKIEARDGERQGLGCWRNFCKVWNLSLTATCQGYPLWKRKISLIQLFSRIIRSCWVLTVYQEFYEVLNELRRNCSTPVGRKTGL